MSARLAVLVGTKGRGSNMANLVSAGREGIYPGEVVLVVAPSAEAPALAVAQELGVETQAIPRGPDFGAELLWTLQTHNIDLICLAGFMFLLPVDVLRAYPDRVLNIHPALLPKFGGKGMYGHYVHEAVIAAGETESGATVHYVNENYDEGGVIMQLTCPIDPSWNAEDLAQVVLSAEHMLYPVAVLEVLSRLDGTSG